MQTEPAQTGSPPDDQSAASTKRYADHLGCEYDAHPHELWGERREERHLSQVSERALHEFRDVEVITPSGKFKKVRHTRAKAKAPAGRKSTKKGATSG